MMRLKHTRYLLLLSSILMLTLVISGNPYRAMSTEPHISGDVTTSSKLNKNDLYKSIQSYSDQRKIEPIDAKVDRIQKAMPGYNGLSVNIEASYKVMEKAKKFDKSKVIYKEIPPNVHLEDLAPEPIYRGNPQKHNTKVVCPTKWKF